MPILKVMFDRKLDQKVDLIAQDLIDSFTQVLADVLESKRATPQVLLMTRNWLSSDFPIYVELQFRDTPVRNEAKAFQVLEIVGNHLFRSLASEFGLEALRLMRKRWWRPILPMGRVHYEKAVKFFFDKRC